MAAVSQWEVEALSLGCASVTDGSQHGGTVLSSQVAGGDFPMTPECAGGQGWGAEEGSGRRTIDKTVPSKPLMLTKTGSLRRRRAGVPFPPASRSHQSLTAQ
jgi:hypothetical protein